jgi:hypothetical protein
LVEDREFGLSGVARGGISRLFPALRLGAQQFGPPTLRLAHHAGGLGSAFQDERHIRRMFAGQAHAIQGLGTGRDILVGEIGFVGIAGVQGRGVSDGSEVRPRRVLARGGGWRNDLMMQILGEVGGGAVHVHSRTYAEL